LVIDFRRRTGFAAGIRPGRDSAGYALSSLLMEGLFDEEDIKWQCQTLNR